MVAGLLAFLLGFAPTSAQPDSTPFDRFAFRCEDAHHNMIDTIEGSITRDACDGLWSSGHVRLSKKQLRAIYDRLMALRAFEIREPYPQIGEGPRWINMGGSRWHRVDIRAGHTIRHFEWGSGPYDPDNPEWRRLFAVRAVLDSTLRALPEFQKLPPPPCTYFD